MKCTGRDKHNVLCRHLDQPLPSPLPFITQHRWRARAGAGRRRRHNTHVKAVPAVSVLRRAPPADWPACGLELVYVQTCPELQAHDGCAGCIYLLKETDAPAVVDIRQAAPLVSQRGARQTRAALETQQKGDRWKIRFFVASFGKWSLFCVRTERIFIFFDVRNFNGFLT